ncbi:methyl coenzyme M reductase subunit gamma [Rothia mucilaginosa]|uniref:methyl coenzyme M reductase subunit gamma n=1 Tax=Rothia mucilaginosa TaxID=43675 RepID=UPI0026EB79EF|nr:methyl coenzyme M reductase subunit gamma [Rothia mucilaginosa]
MMFSRTTRTSIAALSAAMMLTLSACSGGVQVSAESSASTSASTESANAEASVTPTATPSPTPTGPSGSEIVLVRPSVDTNNDSKEAEKAALVAAYAVLDQHLRVKNAWVHGDLEHTSDEELLQYVDKRILESVKKQAESMRKLAVSSPVEGDIVFRDVRFPSIYSLEHSDGSKPSQPNAGIAITYCEDTSNIRMSDGRRLNASQTRRIFIVRRDDGAYVLGSTDIEHEGCDYEVDEVV